MRTLEFVLDNAEPGVPTILVGANGAGKSRFLLALGLLARNRDRKIITISNTVFDRLREVPAAKRISASQGALLPSGLMKSALKEIVDRRDGLHRFQEIGTVLRYCNYAPEIGFRVALNEEATHYDLHDKMINAKIRGKYFDEIAWCVDMLYRRDFTGVTWLHLDGDISNVSRSFDLTRIVALEGKLKKLGLVQSIEVYLKTDTGYELPMSHASSGQLSVISTFVFLAITLTDEPAWLLIDEPENSLHPQWQRAYVERLLEVLKYRNIRVVIATHAPVLVSGAKLDNAPAHVFQIHQGMARPIAGINGADREGVEAILWEVFETVTPANHFMSTKLVEELEKVERGQQSAAHLTDIVNQFKRASYDERQELMLENVLDLARKVEERRKQFVDNAKPDGGSDRAD
jgi:ABC-type Mn2+/Zn2+ transport system ATPase subunit